jgi:hypothetical protein
MTTKNGRPQQYEGQCFYRISQVLYREDRTQQEIRSDQISACSELTWSVERERERVPKKDSMNCQY